MYLAQITAGTSNKEFLENKIKPPLKFLNFLGERCDLILTSGCSLEPENAVGFNLITVDNNKTHNGNKTNFETVLIIMRIIYLFVSLMDF